MAILGKEAWNSTLEFLKSRLPKKAVGFMSELRGKFNYKTNDEAFDAAVAAL